MKFWNKLKEKLENLKLRLRLRLWLKLLECCTKLTGQVLREQWSRRTTILPLLQQSQLQTWEDLSLSLPQAMAQMSDGLEQTRS